MGILWSTAAVIGQNSIEPIDAILTESLRFNECWVVKWAVKYMIIGQTPYLLHCIKSLLYMRVAILTGAQCRQKCLINPVTVDCTEGSDTQCLFMLKWRILTYTVESSITKHIPHALHIRKSYRQPGIAGNFIQHHAEKTQPKYTDSSSLEAVFSFTFCPRNGMAQWTR